MALNGLQGVGVDVALPHAQDLAPARPTDSGDTVATARTDVATSAQPPQQATKVDPKQVAAAVQQANAHLSDLNRNVRFSFSVDPDTKQVVVKMLDAQTGDLIRQIPSQQMLDISKNLEKPQGLVLQQKA